MNSAVVFLWKWVQSWMSERIISCFSLAMYSLVGIIKIARNKLRYSYYCLQVAQPDF